MNVQNADQSQWCSNDKEGSVAIVCLGWAVYIIVASWHSYIFSVVESSLGVVSDYGLTTLFSGVAVFLGGAMLLIMAFAYNTPDSLGRLNKPFTSLRLWIPAFLPALAAGLMYLSLLLFTYGVTLTTPEDMYRVYATGEVVAGGHESRPYDPWRADSLVVDPNILLPIERILTADSDVGQAQLTYQVDVSFTANQGMEDFLSYHASGLGVGENSQVQEDRFHQSLDNLLIDVSHLAEPLFAELRAGTIDGSDAALLIRFNELARSWIEQAFSFSSNVRINSVTLDWIDSGAS